MAGGIVSAQTATTETDAPMGTRPEVRVYSSGLGLGFPFNSTGGFLGVYPAEVTSEIASKYAMSDPHGALLTKVEENTAASRAGLQVDDIIVEWNGTRVESGVMLRRMINETPVGRKVRIGYLRNGARADVETTLESRPGMNMPEIFPNGLKEFKDFKQFKMEDMTPEMRERLEKMMENAPKLGGMHMMVGDGRMGATLQNITPQLATYFGVRDDAGALVGSVREGSAAEKGGLQVGDVIVSIDGQKVGNPGDVARTIAKKDKGEVELGVIRDKAEQTLRITLDGPAMNGGFGLPDMENFNGMKFFRNMPPNMKFNTPNGEIEIMIAPPAMEDDGAAPNSAEPDNAQPELGSLFAPRSNGNGEVTMKHIPSRESAPDASRARVLGIDI